MGTKPKAPKYFEVTVKIPTSVIKDVAESIVCWMEDEYDVSITTTKVLALEEVRAWVIQYVAKTLEMNYDLRDAGADFIYDGKAEKFFKTEIAAQKARARELEKAKPAKLIITLPQKQVSAAREQLEQLGYTLE